MRILITGGAGFIGSHLADELLAHGHEVRALDSLVEQVHGPGQRRPVYLNPRVELLVGDIRDGEAVAEALDGVDVVYHFAAAVGVGQSMDMPALYVSVNTVGTAVLLEALRWHPVERLVVASSMSVYGEGARLWGEPVPTTEDHPPLPASVYALTKLDQERLCLVLGKAAGVPTVALRFFNVYGPRQSLTNPYTGILAIFAARLLAGQPPIVFEDGEQRRDFVHVSDVARACRMAMDAPDAVGQAINIGSGSWATVRQVAELLADGLGMDISPEITGTHRPGDVRHCFADISRARRVLGYSPLVSLAEGVAELCRRLRG